MIKFVLIDDDIEDIDMMKLVFNESNQECSLTTFEKGLDALDYMQELQESGNKIPDVIILDMKMPGLNGSDVLTRLKSHISLRYIPVIIFSTSISNDDILELYNKGASCYMCKPVKRSEYKTVIDKMIDFWSGSVSLPNR